MQDSESKYPEDGPDFTPWPTDVAERYRESGYWQGKSLDRIVSDGALHFGDKTAVVCGARRVSFRQLDKQISGLAAGFRDLGIRAKDRVVVQLPNVLEAIQTIFALFRMGGVPVLALPGHRQADISYFIHHAQAKAYVASSALADDDANNMARAIMAEPDCPLEHVVLLGECDEFIAFETLTASLFAQKSEMPSFAPVDPAAIALLQLSGGSTGTPKLIPRTHDDYLYSVRRSAEICGLDSDAAYLVALPLAHNFSLSSPGALGCLLCGGTVVLTEDPSPDGVFPLIQREDVTMVAAVPPLAIAWRNAAYARGLRFDGLVLQVGGAKLAVEQAESLLDDLGCRLQQVFGMAEGLVCYTPLSGSRDEIVATQGRPMSPDDEVRIVDDRDRDVQQGHPGQLLTRGPYTIRGYFRAGSHNLIAFTKDGFYRTGDIVARTPSGSLIVVGRSKDQINRGGEKIAPTEIERHLACHPEVLATAVIGIPDQVRGERIGAFVVQRPGSSLTRRDLVVHLRRRGVAAFKIPDHFEFVRELPKTSVGKINTRALSLVSPPPPPPAPTPSHVEISDVARAADPAGVRPFDLVSELAHLLQLERDQLTPTLNLLECGLDSLHLMQLVERFRACGIDTSFIELAENPTIADFSRIVAQAQRLRPLPEEKAVDGDASADECARGAREGAK